MARVTHFSRPRSHLPDGSTTRRTKAASKPRPTWRRVAIPTEHGGWSLTGEPVLLGLAVSWSWAGLALGVAAVLAFLARTPLKFVLVDRRRHKWYERSGLAARIAAVELGLILVLVVGAFLTAQSRWFWVPFVLAAPLVAVQLWFDRGSRSRLLIPELAGAVGISSVGASIALAGGSSPTVAVGVAVVLAARAAAAIPYARAQVFRVQGRPVTLWHSDVAQLLALVTVAVTWWAGALPVAALAAVAVVAVFNMVALRRPAPPIKVVGLQQLAFGLGVVVVTAAAILATS